MVDAVCLGDIQVLPIESEDVPPPPPSATSMAATPSKSCQGEETGSSQARSIDIPVAVKQSNKVRGSPRFRLLRHLESTKLLRSSGSVSGSRSSLLSSPESPCALAPAGQHTPPSAASPPPAVVAELTAPLSAPLAVPANLSSNSPRSPRSALVRAINSPRSPRSALV